MIHELAVTQWRAPTGHLCHLTSELISLPVSSCCVLQAVLGLLSGSADSGHESRGDFPYKLVGPAWYLRQAYSVWIFVVAVVHLAHPFLLRTAPSRLCS